MPVDGIKKTKEERTVATEQAEFGWHTITTADSYGEGAGVQPAGFIYSGIRAVGGSATVEFVNGRGQDDNSSIFQASGDGAFDEATFDQGVYEPGLYSSVKVTAGEIRAYIAYETPEL